jgi:aryl-alcohol dehydrogenase-like predicted oxidoreductase
MTPQICLGTAQFGQAYGITNAAGQVGEPEVKAMLELASTTGLRWLDTAQSYGSAEAVLGRILPRKHRFSLISKLPAQPQDSFTAEDQSRWEKRFQATREALGCDRLNGFLLHAPADLRKRGSKHLEDWLRSLRQRGLVRRLGVSIYGAEDLEGLPLDLLDLVQVPISLYDQRLVLDGTLHWLHSQGVAIHARSLYLQGLLLAPAASWPAWVAPEARAHQQRLEEFARQRDCTLLDLAMGFAREQSTLEAVVVGLCSRHQLRELLTTWGRENPWQDDGWRNWNWSDPSLLDPRRWPR